VRQPWRHACTGLVGLLLLASGTARLSAAEWSWSPTLSFWVDHDSNRDLAPQAIGGEGTFVSLDLQLRYATERLSLTLHPQIAVQRFSGSSFPDSNDLSLTAGLGWVTERSSYSVTGLVDEQSLLTTELPVTGIVEPGTRRRDEDIGVSWTYAQTPLWSLTLQGSYSDSIYLSDIAAQTPLQNFHGTSFSVTEQYQYSDRLALFVTPSESSYAQGGLPAPFRTEGVVAGLKLQFSERTTLSVDAGGSRTTFESLSSNGFLGDLNLTRTTETGSFSLSASRNVSPAGLGEVTQQDTVRLSAQRDISARLNVSGSASVFRYSSVFHIPGLITIDLSALDRTYAQAVAGLTWRATETWSLGTQVLTTRVTGPAIQSAADWQVRLQASWTPFPHSLSR
jgi:hypothetical protein